MRSDAGKEQKPRLLFAARVGYAGGQAPSIGICVSQLGSK